MQFVTEKRKKMPKRYKQQPARFVLDVALIYFEKHCSRAAAELAYFLILSFFPALICLNAVIGTLHLDVAYLLSKVSLIIPAEAVNVLSEYIRYITENQSTALLIGGAAATFFPASSAIRSLMNIMSEIYGKRSYTGLWQIVASVAFSVLFLLTIYLSLVVLLTGNWFFHLIENFLHRFPRFAHITLPWEWQWMRFVLLFCLVMVFVMLLYRFTAPREQPRPPVLLGAFLASVALVIASVIFSTFISLSSRYSLVYGSLASVVILLVWLYLLGNILILGSCVNRTWYAHSQKNRKED